MGLFQSLAFQGTGDFGRKVYDFCLRGECTKDDDINAFSVFSLVIADHLERNSKAVKKQKKLLALA